MSQFSEFCDGFDQHENNAQAVAERADVFTVLKGTEEYRRGQRAPVAPVPGRFVEPPRFALPLPNE